MKRTTLFSNFAGTPLRIHGVLRSTFAVLVAASVLAGNQATAGQQMLSGSGGATLPGLSWATAGNWSPAVLPGVNDNAIVTATGLVDVQGSTLDGAAEIQDLSFTGAAAVTLQNNSSSVAMVLSLNGGRGAGVPLISATAMRRGRFPGRGRMRLRRRLGWN